MARASYGCEGVAVLAWLQLPRYSYTRVQQHMSVLTASCVVPGAWQHCEAVRSNLCFPHGMHIKPVLDKLSGATT